MAKASKKQKQKKEVKRTAPTTSQIKIESKHLDIAFPVLLVILFIFLMKPLLIDGLTPQGVDVVSNIASTHQTKQFAKETGEKALWNPYKFSGMPTYHRHNAVAFSLDNILRKLGNLFNGAFFYYLFGALGLYFFFRYLKFTPLISLLGVLVFILIPHFKSLYMEGHFYKFQAIMIIPWIVFTFYYFLDKKSLLGAALFALAFGLQIRTQHYQIVFYTGLLIFAIGVYPFLKLLFDKEYKLFGKSTALLFASLLLAILMAAQPLFLAKEYLPYSKRGKTTINIKQQKIEATTEQDGVNLNYATQWSTHPSELMTWFMPRFYGGKSVEKYTGNAIPQVKGRDIPGYWGYMPFTQSYEYMGIISLMLAFIGIWFYRKDKFIISLLIFSGFLILLSLGRHFEGFYSLFFNYFPFFNKFRAPMMSVTLNYFILSIFAIYGVKYLYELVRDEFDWKKYKNLLVILGSFVGLGIIFWITGQSMSFTKIGENYNPQVMPLFIEARKEFFFNDLTRYFILILIVISFIISYLKNKINFTVLSLIIIAAITFDLLSVQHRVVKKFINLKKVENRYFSPTNTDKFLSSDDETFRILPPAKSMNDNRWAYFHQTIGGYSPIKMYTIEELIENNVFAGWNKQLPINWNVLQMLNVKYAVFQNKFVNENLTLVHSNVGDKLYTYSLNNYLARGYFVGKAKIIEDDYDRLKFINTPQFKPSILALLEKELHAQIETPDSSFCSVKEFTPNRILLDAFTDKQSLFVISEMYYPPGWKIFVDNVEVEKIYKPNHALMSIILSAGKHEVELRFEPDSYYENITMSYASLGIIYVVIIFSVVNFYRAKKRDSSSVS
jgi:hypothetical protein